MIIMEDGEETSVSQICVACPKFYLLVLLESLKKTIAMHESVKSDYASRNHHESMQGEEKKRLRH